MIRVISKHGINEEFVIRIIFLFWWIVFATQPVKGVYKFGFFDGIFGDFQEKHEFATLLKNTSALPRDFMIRVDLNLSYLGFIFVGITSLKVL